MVHVVPPAGWNITTVESAPQDPSVWPPASEPAGPKPAPAPRQTKSPQPAKAKVAAAVIPPALPPRPAPPPVAAAKVAGQPPLPTSAASATVAPPPVPTAAAVASSTKSVAGANQTAARFGKLTNWARQEWKFLAGGVGAGIALGGTMWLVLAMQTPSAPLVAELSNDSAPPGAALVESLPLASTAPRIDQTLPAPAHAVEEGNTKDVLPSDPADKLAGEPQDPSAAAAPIAAAPVVEPAPLDKPAKAPPAHVDGPPDATEEKNPPVASAPQPTIKLEPAPVKPAAAQLPPEAASILNTAEADAAADAPAAVRTPTSESPGAERPELTAAKVDERLSRALPAAQFTKAPLFQFVEFIAELTNLPIQLDEPALRRSGKSRQSAVTVKLNDTTAGDALRAALSDLGLVTAIRSGVVVVTVAPEAKGAE